MKIVTKEVLIKSIKAVSGNKQLCDVICYLVENDLWKDSCCGRELWGDTKDAKFWDSIGEENDLAFLYLSGKQYSNTLSSIKDYSFINETFYDSRYKCLCLSNLRKFPATSDNRPYGINFMQNGQPASLALIGANGTGKTSLYIGMEYTMTHHLSAARMRKIPETEFKKFITYGTESYDNVQVKIQTMDNLIFKDKENERMYKYQDSLPCFFCSEYDLIKTGESTPENLLKYVVSQIGFYELLKFKKYIQDKINTYTEYVEHNKKDMDDFLRVRIKLRDQKIHKAINEIVSKEKFSLFSKNIRELRPLYVGYLFCLKKCDIDTPLPRIDDSIGDTNTLDAPVLEDYINQFDDRARLFLECFKDFLNGYNSPEYQGLIDNPDINPSQLKIWIEEQRKRLSTILHDDTKPTRLRLLSYIQFDFEEKRQIISEVIFQMLTFMESEGTMFDFEAFTKDILSLSGADDEIKDLNKKITNHEEEKKIDRLKGYLKVKELLVDLEIFYANLDAVYQKQLEILEHLFKPYIEDILTFFALDGNEKYILSINGDRVDIKIIYKDVNGNEVSTKPRDYLNSFRYKLFNMTLKIAMAFSAMRLNKIIHPIIFDDVFYSSDFENRNRIEEFIARTYEAYEKFVREDNKNCPDLQLIFLSHDDIIVDAIRGGIHTLDGTQVKTPNVIYGRLFDYREMNKQEDIVKVGIHEFNNLYVKF